MLSRVDGVWMEEGGEEDVASWTQAHLNPAGELGSEAKDVLEPPRFRSMLEDDWYINMSATSAAHHGGFEGLQTHPDIKDISFPADPPLLPPPVDSSSSSSFFNLDAPQTAISFRLNPFGFDPGFLPPPQMPVFMNRDASAAGGVLGLSGQMGCPGLSPGARFSVPGFTSGAGLHAMGFENSPLLNRSKVLGSLEILPRVGAPPTLFQKRAAALSQNAAIAGEQGGSLSLLCSDGGGQVSHEKRTREMEEEEIDGSGLNYYSDEAKGEDSAKNGSGEWNNSNDGEHKGKKKKGVPAKNLMAERRRRKKLNDRLYMLRSIVPKISKMDRTSILGDAIEYLKELMQRINDLHNELESTPSSSSLPATNSTSFQPSTPTPPTLPCCVKELSPNNQPARVDVRVREGRAVNIHMFSPRRPGLLLSTMRALDGLGLDIQQAVISCFNVFALDVFRAEQCKDGPDVLPDEIQAVLLQSVGFHGMM